MVENRMTWAEQTIEHLQSAKAAGVRFDTAWADTTLTYPPSPRDFGLRSAETLDDELELADATAWFRTVCEDAWHGRRGRLQHLPAPGDG
jgi:hypothetical protein